MGNRGCSGKAPELRNLLLSASSGAFGPLTEEVVSFFSYPKSADAAGSDVLFLLLNETQLCQSVLEFLSLPYAQAKAFVPRGNTASPGSEVSRGGFPKDVLVQREIRHHFLHPRVLPFQLAQTLSPIHAQASVFLAPPGIGLLRNPQLLTDLAHGHAPGNLHLGFS